MSARRLALLAAALVFTASELALWLEVRSAVRGQAELRRRLMEHRCPTSTFAAPVPASDFLTPKMPDSPRLGLEPATDPALENGRG